MCPPRPRRVTPRSMPRRGSHCLYPLQCPSRWWTSSLPTSAPWCKARPSSKRRKSKAPRLTTRPRRSWETRSSRTFPAGPRWRRLRRSRQSEFNWEHRLLCKVASQVNYGSISLHTCCSFNERCEQLCSRDGPLKSPYQASPADWVVQIVLEHYRTLSCGQGLPIRPCFATLVERFAPP